MQFIICLAANESKGRGREVSVMPLWKGVVMGEVRAWRLGRSGLRFGDRLGPLLLKIRLIAEEKLRLLISTDRSKGRDLERLNCSTNQCALHNLTQFRRLPN
jgi:hypothetical protein